MSPPMNLLEALRESAANMAHAELAGGEACDTCDHDECAEAKRVEAAIRAIELPTLDDAAIDRAVGVAREAFKHAPCAQGATDKEWTEAAWRAAIRAAMKEIL